MQNDERTGIKHLYNADLKNQSFVVSDEELKIIQDYIKSNGNKINYEPNKGDVSISEKVDGASLKFGLDEEKKFFIESSRSGIQYSGDSFVEHSKNIDIGLGYKDMFEHLKSDVELQKVLSGIFESIGSFKIFSEILYNGFGKENPLDSDLISFVKIYYDRSKLGSWGTIVLLDIKGEKRNFGDKLKNKVFESIVKLSNKELKFYTSSIDKKIEIDFKGELNRKNINDTIAKKITNHNWGSSTEGIVIKIPNITFKITSDTFKEEKKKELTLKEMIKFGL